jgi:hypothetical protein
MKPPPYRRVMNRTRIVNVDLREKLHWLRDLRVKADYREDQVELEEASLAFDRAHDVLLVVLEGEG